MVAHFMSGVFATGMIFLISLLIVLGIKWVYYTLKKQFDNKNQNTNPQNNDNANTTPKKRKRKTTRTIEIDPDLADRIYFKKSS